MSRIKIVMPETLIGKIVFYAGIVISALLLINLVLGLFYIALNPPSAPEWGY